MLAFQRMHAIQSEIPPLLIVDRFSSPARLAVLYVFPKSPMDAERAATRLADQVQQNGDILESRKNLLLLSDVAYQWKLGRSISSSLLLKVS